MKTHRLILLSLLLLATLLPAAAASDNVKVTKRLVAYEIRDNAGEPAHVKKTDRISFLAQRTDASAIAFTYYNDEVKVDKASAPGASPVYMRAEDDNIFYDDGRICMLKVPLEKGKEKEAVLQTSSSNPEMATAFTLASMYDTDEFTVTFTVAPALAQRVKVTPLNFPASAVITTVTDKKGNAVHSFTIKNLKQSRSEKLGEPFSLHGPKIVVTGIYKDLAALYAHLHAFTSTPDPGNAEVAAMAAEITKGLNTDSQKINAIANWVRQNIRYVAVEHGEYGKRPDLASAVLQKRFGDCKGSANLIKAMLVSQGIDARLAWIGTRDHIGLRWSDFASPAIGNHMIAAVVRPDTTLFIDGTVTYGGADYLPHSIQGQQALIEDGDNFMLADVPVLAPNTNLDKQVMQFAITPEGLKAHARRHLSGLYCNIFENTYNSVTASKRDQLLRAIISGDKNSITLDSISYSRPDPLADNALLEYASLNKAAVKKAGQYVYVEICPIADSYLQTVDTLGRRSAIVNGVPRRIEAEATLQLPTPDATVELPDNAVIDTPWFKGEISYTLSGDQVKCNAWLETAALRAEPAEAAKWNDAVKQVNRTLQRRLKIANNQ